MTRYRTAFPSRRFSRLAVRLGLISVLILLATVAAIMVLLSPLALPLLGDDGGTDWSLLSNIGQTYGAVSALLAALALGGVVGSLVLQSREARAAREQALRTLHVELLRMALDDPLYLRCWGPFSSKDEEDARRQHIYVNLIVNHWQMMYEVDAVTEEQLRAMAGNLFDGDVGRRFWRDAREVRLATTKGRRAIAFQRLVDEEYLGALSRNSD